MQINDKVKVAVVIPCFNVAESIERVIETIPKNIEKIICVNDCSSDKTEKIIKKIIKNNPRVFLVTHKENQGVGGAMKTGYTNALSFNLDIVVKIDGDGQMDPKFIPKLIKPITGNQADYTKGNRFFDVESIKPMPIVRIIGNAGLSFFSKLSTGYWSLFDPTNGFTAISVSTLKHIPLSKLSDNYFFESDLLFRLSTIRAKSTDIPMMAIYGNEKSNLNSFNSLVTFPILHLRNFIKRIIYNYFLRNFSIASVNFALGILLIAFGGWYGFHNWLDAYIANTTTPAGVVMLAALPMILGSQALLSFLSFDIANEPSQPISENIKTDYILNNFDL
jgi:dolichol-phosphate mannosyltransferase